MSLCCTNIGDLGCFTNCEEIKTGLTATQNGDYLIREYWLSAVNDQTVSLLIGEDIDFLNIYNETSEHTIKIFNPDGSVITSGIFDCFRFYTNAIS